jgi:UDP-N-acetylmuramoylalanine-D-glutamate ligase
MKREQVIKGSLVKSKFTKTVVEVTGSGNKEKEFSGIVVVATSSYKLGYHSDTWHLDNFEVVIENSGFLKQNTISELNNKDLVQVVKDIKKLVEVSNTTRLITCTVTIGKSKEETLLSFMLKDFLRIEDSQLILSNDERRLKLCPGQISCIERQLSGESKI